MNKASTLSESKTFCVFPWNHLHVTPAGTSAPCCISKSCDGHEGMGDAKTGRLMELVNSPKMNQLRLDMINGIEPDECSKCHDHERAGVKSFREEGLLAYPKTVEDAVNNTNDDGSLTEFNMRYYDMRFSNLCNFKCRTCNQEYSSQWEQENRKHDPEFNSTIKFPKGANKELLQDAVAQIKNLEKAYFAGGEPLIMEEHYILLEEMIRQGRTDIILVYNSNISNLRYKDKDLIALWKHFKNDIRLYASIDHVRERAEYIRHGTDWGVIEQNIIKLRQHDFIKITMNTVLSIFNFLTIDKFYQYLIVNGLYANADHPALLYCMSTPQHMSCHSMPTEFKELGNESLERAINLMTVNKFRPSKLAELTQARSWAMSQDSWLVKDQYNYTNKVKFRMEIERLDKIRGEKFENVFPELIPLLEQTYE